MSRRKPRRFALLRKLGEGSIGVVYEAYDRERSMRVALKTLRHLDREALYRLKLEFRAVRRLNHPNIVTLHELVQDGSVWSISMELIDGNDFVGYVRNDGQDAEILSAAEEPFAEDQPRPRFGEIVDETRLRKTLSQLAQGLHAIHLAGLIHRDLKPSNVRVTELGRVVLMDFSIVAEARNAIDYSSSGSIIIGTPWYMAPEQATGDPPTAAVDWYAMGAMIYQAVT
ncbi:MAG: serine/threonine-protein kinase, partial [Myxococcota bacterium]